MKLPHLLSFAPAGSGAALALLVGLLAPPTALAQLTIDATVTPYGGSFAYDLTITNHDPSEYFLVSFTDAPIGDPLIGATLLAPAGFLASYDGGIGFLDFLADSSSFLSGRTVGGFRFESLADPTLFFTQVEGLDSQGNLISGQVNLTVIPESNAVGAGALLAVAVVTVARKRRMNSSKSISPSHA